MPAIRNFAGMARSYSLRRCTKNAQFRAPRAAPDAQPVIPTLSTEASPPRVHKSLKLLLF